MRVCRNVVKMLTSNIPGDIKPSDIVGASSLYQESKRARLEREKEEKRRRLEEETEFSAEDLSLATVPGLEFDPKQRSFDLEELRPQPIIKKRRKLYAADSQKVSNSVLSNEPKECLRLEGCYGQETSNS